MINNSLDDLERKKMTSRTHFFANTKNFVVIDTIRINHQRVCIAINHVVIQSLDKVSSIHQDLTTFSYNRRENFQYSSKLKNALTRLEIRYL